MADPSGGGRPLLVIVGPTAVGKTDVGIRVARSIGGEIVSADSRQVYRGMDIGTAKPTPAQRAEVAHHLLDLVDPDETYDAGRFSRDAQTAISAIRTRGGQPMVVGGCGLYVRGLLDGFSPVPDVAPEVKDRVREGGRGVDSAALHARLRQVDPTWAERVRPSDRQRVLRGLEVFEGTGEPLSAWQQLPCEGRYLGEVRMVGLRMEREVLHRRIDDRTRQMFSGGLVGEVERLRAQGYGRANSALVTFGYLEVLDYLEGRAGLEEAIQVVQKETRRYAKRQMTWFRGDRRVGWVEADDSDIADRIIQEWEAERGPAG